MSISKPSLYKPALVLVAVLIPRLELCPPKAVLT